MMDGLQASVLALESDNSSFVPRPNPIRALSSHSGEIKGPRPPRTLNNTRTSSATHTLKPMKLVENLSDETVVFVRQYKVGVLSSVQICGLSDASLGRPV